MFQRGIEAGLREGDTQLSRVGGQEAKASTLAGLHFLEDLRKHILLLSQTQSCILHILWPPLRFSKTEV